MGVDQVAVIAGVKWDKRIQDFGSIPGVLSYEEERLERMWKSRQREFYNFNQQPLEITYYEEPRFFEFRDNDTKATGICGDMWTALSEFLNFTLVLKRIESNVTIGGYDRKTTVKLFEYATQNKTDIIPITMVSSHESQGVVKYTPIFWTNRLRIFSQQRWKADSDWMFDVFTWEVWLTVLVTVILLSFACIVAQTFLKYNEVTKLNERSYFGHLFNTFSSLCNQGTSSDNTGGGSRLLTFTIGLFSWMSLAAYTATLMNNLTVEIIDSPFSDLKTLFFNTKLEILVVFGSLGHFTFFNQNSSKIFGRIIRANRLSTEPNISEVYRKVCLNPDKYVLFDEEDEIATRNKMMCELVPVDIPRHPIHIASAMSGRVRHKDTIVIGIMKLQEFGVLDLIKSRYMTSSLKRQPSVRQSKRVFVDWYRVFLIFTILAIGIIASIVICIIEIVVFSLSKRRK